MSGPGHNFAPVIIPTRNFDTIEIIGKQLKLVQEKEIGENRINKQNGFII